MLKEFAPNTLLPNQPHVLVYYDETYLAIGDANYDPTSFSGAIKPSCQLFYVPYRLILAFGSLHQAFGYFTKKADIHLADYEGGKFYRNDGTPWPEHEYSQFAGLDLVEDMLTQ